MRDKEAHRMLANLQTDIISMSNRLRFCEEVLAKRSKEQPGLAELESRIFAYLDGYYHGREFLFEGDLGNAIYERDILTLFRRVIDLAVNRFHRIRELEEEVSKAKQAKDK